MRFKRSHLKNSHLLAAAALFVWAIMPVKSLAQHPFSKCEKSTTLKGKTNLGIPIQSWEVNQATRISKCEIAWIGRPLTSKKAFLVISNLKGELMDSVALQSGLENHKLVALGKGKFMFLDLHLLEANLNYILLERVEDSWTWKDKRRMVIPEEISGLNAYLVQASLVTQKQAKGKDNDIMFALQQPFLADDKLYVLFKRTPVKKADQLLEKQSQDWFLLAFNWFEVSREFKYAETVRLYLQKHTEESGDCGAWQFQPALSTRNEKQIILKHGNMMPVWYKTDSRTSEPAIQLQKRQHHFVVTSALLPADLHCLAWKVGSTFIPGLDNKAVKSDKPVTVGMETVKIKDGYLMEKPRALEQDSMLDAVFLAEGDDSNLWMLPAANWCQQSGGAAGIFEFNRPVMVICQ
jgi:hypothetical protein